MILGGKNLNFKIDEKHFSPQCNHIDINNQAEIVQQVKADLLKKFNEISLTELEILSRNIYDYSYLIAHEVSKKDIAEYFVAKNNYYLESLTDIDKQNMIPSDNQKLRFSANLINKYIKLLRNSINSL